jgi:hypothetical protein
MFSDLQNVDDLELQGVIFQAMQECVELVYAFPKLQTLSMVNTFWEDRISPESLHLFRQGPPFRLRSIGLDWNLDEALDWFLARDPLPTVETLHYYGTQAACQRLIATMGQHVTTLDIDLRNANTCGSKPGNNLLTANDWDL